MHWCEATDKLLGLLQLNNANKWYPHPPQRGRHGHRQARR